MIFTKNWQLKILLFTGFAPAIAAWFIASTGWGLPQELKNHGQLMSAGLVVPQEVKALQGNRWGLILIGDNCEATCKEQLILMQQVHKALGKEFGRLQSIWLKSNNHELFPPLHVSENTTQSTEKMSAWLVKNQLPTNDYSIWLTDPMGNLVLQFSPGVNGKDILEDIRWLLKASQIG
jgi:hypothetical protein